MLLGMGTIIGLLERLPRRDEQREKPAAPVEPTFGRTDPAD